MNRYPVALFPSSAKAEPIKQQLRSSGFAAEAHDEGWLPAFWFVNAHKCGVQLDVPAHQFERAEQFLLDLDAREHALTEAIRCPECGSFRVLYPQFARHSILTNLALGVAAQFGLVEKHFYCEDCHFTWPREGTRSSRIRPHQAPYYFIEGIEQTRQPEVRRNS
jgi:transposase-like protein